VPSAEQADNPRRRRAEDRIPQIAQDRVGLLTFTVGNKASALPARPGAATTSAPDSSTSAPRSGGHKIDCGGPDLAGLRQPLAISHKSIQAAL
jgi:hypothetical protein